MQASPSFTKSFHALLAAANAQARQLEDDGVLSLALPLDGGDPLQLLPLLEPDGDGDGCGGGGLSLIHI